MRRLISKNNTIWFYFLLIPLFLGSCRARFYTPNRNPVPLYREKGEVFIDASTNMFNKADLTIGTALTDNIGAYIGYGGSTQTVGSDSANDRKYSYRGNLLNFGLGYYLNRSQSENFRFEIYGDYVTGNFRNKVSGMDNEFFNGNLRRVGIMPSIGYRASDDAFTIAYSVRYSKLSFFNPKLSDSSFWSSDIKRYNYASSYDMLEQSLTMRFGTDKLKFQIQTALYQALNANNQNNYEGAVPYINFALMVGVVYNFNWMVH